MSRLCLLSGYSRQAYYKQQQVQQKEQLHQELLIQQVIAIRKLQKRLGGRKLLLLLQPFIRQHNISIGRDAFFELLGTQGLLIRRKRHGKPKTTFSQHWMHKYPNLVKAMVSSRAGELWVSDITYINVAEGHAYLSLVTDAYSRKVVGYHLSETLSARGCIAALKMALSGRAKALSLIHHSDRGSQYCCGDYVDLLKANDIGISMTESGDPRDNAIAERVNGILKTELLEEVFCSIAVARNAIEQAVNTYNYLRPHSSVAMLTPALAHGRSGGLKRCWKNYYKAKPNREAVMDG